MPNSLERRDFYDLWKKTGFDPALRNECLEKAGFAKSTIRTMGKKIAEPVQKIVCREMDRQGMTLTKVVNAHKKLLTAESAAHPGEPDNPTRFRAVDMAYRLRDAFPSHKVDINQRNLSVAISVDTLRAAEEATGEKIIDLIPEDVIEVEPEEPLYLEEANGGKADSKNQ